MLRNKLYIQLHNAIRKNKNDEIISLLKDISAEDQVWILTARSNIVAGTLPFLAATLASDKTFLALVAGLPQANYVEVFNKLEDGNTPLTEALSWGITSRIKTLLSQVDDTTYKGLLNTKDYTGTSLEVLLSKHKSESTNENLLEDIKKMRSEKTFSPVTAMKSLGLHAQSDRKEVKSEDVILSKSNGITP